MKRYVIEAVFDDPDYGVIGSERWFWTANGALKTWNRLELNRRRFKPSGWHYRVRDIKTDKILSKN